jgi:hypothetical protein
MVVVEKSQFTDGRLDQRWLRLDGLTYQFGMNGGAADR